MRRLPIIRPARQMERREPNPSDPHTLQSHGVSANMILCIWFLQAHGSGPQYVVMMSPNSRPSAFFAAWACLRFDPKRYSMVTSPSLSGPCWMTVSIWNTNFVLKNRARKCGLTYWGGPEIIRTREQFLASADSAERMRL